MGSRTTARGATGTIGHAFAAKAPPDGYTLLLGTNSTFAIAPHLYKNLQYDNEKSFAPISLVADQPANPFGAPVAAGQEP